VDILLAIFAAALVVGLAVVLWTMRRAGHPSVPLPDPPSLAEPERVAEPVERAEPGSAAREESAFPHRRRPENISVPDTYRAKSRPPNHGSTWDPYAAEQSRASRARAARVRAASQPDQPSHPDYYTLIGVDRGASEQEIEQQYRRRVARVHPDRFFDNPALREDAERELRQLNEAASVLRDQGRRSAYDAQLDLYGSD
jgi:hypothetical protein